MEASYGRIGCVNTCFIGSYLILSGIGGMAGGFPNLVLDSLKEYRFEPVFFGYLAGIILLTALTSKI